MSERDASDVQDLEAIPIPLGAGILAAVDDGFLACVTGAPMAIGLIPRFHSIMVEGLFWRDYTDG